jgi:hypothetical protein
MVSLTATACQRGAQDSSSAHPTGDAQHDSGSGDTEPMVGQDQAGSGGASLTIIEPQDGAVIKAGQVVIRVTAIGVPAEELHWHLTVDGEDYGMGSGTDMEIPLEAGEHEIVARLASLGHEEAADAPSSTIHVTVEP